MEFKLGKSEDKLSNFPSDFFKQKFKKYILK